MRQKIVLVLAIILALYVFYQRSDWFLEQRGADQTVSSDSISNAFEKRTSNLQVESSGVVTAILKDDKIGARHQKFILRLPSGLTVLIAHNIDLAPRIDNLKKGDVVDFSGEYEWNDKGGVVHWTHHDPAKKHVGGWLRHNGRMYR